MTLIKFLTTQNTYRTVVQANGHSITRTAWAKGTRAWPTWMYFAVAAASVLLNFGTVFSYKFGVERANVASYVTSIFSWVVMLGNLVVWSVAAGMYRSEKDKHGKSNDLWGWTCSVAARAIQKEFAGEVDFDKFCNIQVCASRIGLWIETDLQTERKLVYWTSASRCSVADCGYLLDGGYAQEIKEEPRATIDAEWIRARAALRASV
jgi:hypothetical protein